MDFCSEAGNNLIEDWYVSQSEQVQADFDATLKTLSITPDWRGLKEFKMLGRQYPKLGEIRFRTGNVQYRPVGCFGPGAKSFTILICSRKKQNIYDPPAAFETAEKRMSLLRQGRASLRERTI